jgi:glycosidase
MNKAPDNGPLEDLLRDEGAQYFPWGFPISGQACRIYGVNSALDEAQSDVLAVRKLAEAMNASEDRASGSRPPVRPGELLASGLLLDVMRHIIRLYANDQQPGLTERTTAWLAIHHGEDGIRVPGETFALLYPPVSVLRDDQTQAEFLAAEVHGQPNREWLLWEMTLLSLSMFNHAMEPMRDLFEDSELYRRTQYTKIVSSLETYLASQPHVDPLGMPLFEALRAPMLASPDSIEGQLEFIAEVWAPLLPEEMIKRLRVTHGVLAEETKDHGLGPGPPMVMEFHKGLDGDSDDDHYAEPERFTLDKDWMSNVVLLAKTVYVWLDQLSKEYGRDIQRLDQIPDEELDKLARWGFSGLWLIGVWERSVSSQWIKQRMGNPEAVASAYSLYDYEIAQDLGGQAAIDNLHERAAARGIRLASDMVPNHVGIHSKWVVEHPDWFVGLDHSPYPGYQFNSDSLSPDERVSIQIEDGYYNHSDAAVVFKRTDTWSGEARYIYHGNDGTSMPWNDTAQLNYLNPEVREAVIQTIVHVARMFPIIRFDAAMTLAKKHFQRLWFPKPGDGGAVPSRSEYAMTREEFDAAIPEEFWREVVDRIQKEAPDTLLLAEAFWLMEGYFVRTLGMHRVYNSAFMNMLKMEENQKYRLTMKNVLEFSPEVLKRFVNFMNNPDERTAVEQFGRDDKYFGCATLMATLPGLPMFGHGQIEGYGEKYGMEYRRAYWDESVDDHLVMRHEREIFPLLRRRHLFTGVNHFVLFDFRTQEGHVDENVFAYSNRADDESSLVIYNNAHTNTRGWIHSSSAINRGSAEDPHFEHPSLFEALGLSAQENVYYVFREHPNGLEYVRHSRQLATEGLFVQLHAYEYHVFLNFRMVVDTDGSWGTLAHQLDGQGVDDAEVARKRMLLSPLLDSFQLLFNAEVLNLLLEGHTYEDKIALKKFEGALELFLEDVSQYTTVAFDEEGLAETVQAELRTLWVLRDRLGQITVQEAIRDFLDPMLPTVKTAPAPSPALPEDEAQAWSLPATWLVLRSLGEAFVGTDYATGNAQWLDDWLLTPVVADTLAAFGRQGGKPLQDTQLVLMAVEHGSLVASTPHIPAHEVFDTLLDDAAVRDYLYVNRHEGTLYLNKEQLETLAGWLYLVGVIDLAMDATVNDVQWTKALEARFAVLQRILAVADECGYRAEDILKQLAAPPSPRQET